MRASIPISAMAFRPGVFDDGVRVKLGYVRCAVESMWFAGDLPNRPDNPDRPFERGYFWSVGLLSLELPEGA